MHKLRNKAEFTDRFGRLPVNNAATQILSSSSATAKYSCIASSFAVVLVVVARIIMSSANFFKVYFSVGGSRPRQRFLLFYY